MKKLLINLLVLEFLPCMSLADTVTLKNGDLYDVNPAGTGQEQTELQFAGTRLSFFSEPVEQVILADAPKAKESGIPLIVGIAEASFEDPEVAIEFFINANKTIQQAAHVEDIRPVVSATYIQGLNQKITKGVNENIVLSMMQGLRSDSVRVIDTRIEKGHARLAVMGKSFLGDMQGIVYLVKEGEYWKIEKEAWYSGDGIRRDSQRPLYQLALPNPVQAIENIDQDQPFALSRPQYRIDSDTLNFRNIHPTVRKNAFNFIFFIEKGRAKDAQIDEELGFRKKESTQLHIMWTGPKEMVPSPKIYRNQYPLDVSIADDKNGYVSGEVNLRLPQRKPNEICGTFMMNF